MPLSSPWPDTHSEMSPWLIWQDDHGQPTAPPEIWQTARLGLKLPLQTDWQAVHLFCQERQLPLYLDAQSGPWTPWPASEAGYYCLRLHLPDQHILQTSLFIGARYLNPTQWLNLLQDLRCHLPSRLLQHYARGGQVPVRSDHTLQRSPQEAWRWLQEQLEDSSQGLGLLSLLQTTPPLSTLSLQAGLLPLARQRLWSSALLQQDLINIPPGRAIRSWQLRADQGSEAAFVAATVRQVLQQLQGLAQDLQAQGQREALAPIQVLHQRLQSSWQRHPWHTIKPIAYLPEGILRLMGLPLYRRALTIWQGLQQGFWPDWHTQLRQAYGHLGLLYQYWCLLHAMQGLLKEGLQQGWQMLDLSAPHRRGQGVLKMQKGSQTLTLWHERSFGETGPVRSLTRPQRPDFSLALKKGADLQFWVFEVKFRNMGHQPFKADLDRLHAYRDALRNSQGQAVVQQAILLYPGPARHYPPLLQAWPALPGQVPDWPLSTLNIF